LGETSAARPDHCGQLLLGLAQLGIEVAQVIEELASELRQALDAINGTRLLAH
jgi:hypothetical protein